ncbi:MAG: metalloregulator ArsR/SmtB family transcription factor [Paracoccaceae bacterium]|nr:metalloregulator ArsR/SmtB family transcription factor [Paracoccaceae bacterium]
MVERESDRLTATLKAAADPNRRAILTLLAQEGPLRVTDLAARFPISLNAVSKHIKTLEAAGLVTRRTDWRAHLIELNPGPLAEIDRWFDDLRSIWSLRLEELSRLLMEDHDMIDQMTELALEVSHHIPAPREKVFDAWLDPKMLAKFMTPGPNMSVPTATSDARVGGRFLVVMRAGDNDMPHAGTYREIRRPERLVFTWESPFSQAEGSTVTLDFAESGGGTDVTLRHVRFETEEARDNHKGGWSAILAALEGAV